MSRTTYNDWPQYMAQHTPQQAVRPQAHRTRKRPERIVNQKNKKRAQEAVLGKGNNQVPENHFRGMTRKLTFDTHGNDRQKEVCRYWSDGVTTEIAYGGSKGSGKSFLGCSIIFADALTYPDTLYFIARRSLNDLRKFTVPSIYEVFEKFCLSRGYWKFNAQDNYFTLYNGSKVFLLEAKYMPSDPLYQRFGSMQMTRGWIEEGGEVDSAAKSNLSASVGRWKNDVYGIKGKLLITCNPAKNFLYKDFYKPSREGTLPEFRRFVQAYPTDNKMLPEGYIDHLMKTLDKSQKERLIFGNWEYDDDPAVLCDYDHIVDIFGNKHVPAGEKYITADIARLGKDLTTIARWSGWRVEEIVSIPKSRTTETATAIREIARANGIPMSRVICDEDGVGGGVVDQLSCKGFVNNSRPVVGNYNNLKSECGYMLAGKINEAGLYVSCGSEQVKDAIIEEIEQLKSADVDSDGKQAIMPKADIKEKIGRSPDYLDMLLMRGWFDLPHTTKIKGWGIA